MPMIAHCTVNALPDEMLLRILRGLPLYDLGQVAQTSKRFAQLCCDPQLYPRIELCDRALSERALQAIGVRQPQTLLLRRCHIEETSHLRAALAQAAPRLRELCLESCNGVTDTVVRGLCRLCPGLQSLDLTWCNISNKALQWLAKAPLTQLHTLRFASCAFIGDRGVSALVASRGPQLRRLDLSGCISLTAAGVDAIGLCCPNLEELRLAHQLKVGRQFRPGARRRSLASKKEKESRKEAAAVRKRNVAWQKKR